MENRGGTIGLTDAQVQEAPRGTPAIQFAHRGFVTCVFAAVMTQAFLKKKKRKKLTTMANCILASQLTKDTI